MVEHKGWRCSHSGFCGADWVDSHRGNHSPDKHCLGSVGYTSLADSLVTVSQTIQQLRWHARMRTGFDPRSVSIPKRFLEVETWKGKIDEAYLSSLKNAYAGDILAMAQDE